MIVLCVGVFLAGWTRHVAAADPFVYPGPVSNGYTVHASVPGPAPTVAATIDSPVEGTKFTELPVDVNGSCPLDTYVTLYRNGTFSGVALCEADGTWELSAGLFVGINQLQARVFSPTDVPGPLSNIVVVTYQPPVPPEEPGQTPGDTKSPSTTSTPSKPQPRYDAGGTLIAPLIFQTDFVYNGHYVGDAVSWPVHLEGGIAPYAVSVDWGDGTQELISRPKPGVFGIQHTYKKAGAYKGHYVIKLSASDAEGERAYLQLLTIINNPAGAAATGRTGLPGGIGNGAPDYVINILKYIWPSYGVVVLMLLSFWLGERREYHLLLPRLKKARRA